MQPSEPWTPEQIEEFRERFEAAIASGEPPRILPPSVVPMLVIELAWNADGEVRRETYGPWTATRDESHLAEITEFMAGWRERTGIEPLSATMTALVDPAAWLQGNVTTTAASVPGER